MCFIRFSLNYYKIEYQKIRNIFNESNESQNTYQITRLKSTITPEYCELKTATKVPKEPCPN